VQYPREPVLVCVTTHYAHTGCTKSM
jgi:hypothetical protein